MPARRRPRLLALVAIAVAVLAAAAALAIARPGSGSAPTRAASPAAGAPGPAEAPLAPKATPRHPAHAKGGHPPVPRQVHSRGGPPVSARLVNHGPRTARQIALTFDADMTPSMLARLRAGRVRSWYDRDIVRELRSTRTPGTIFLTGLWTQAYPDAVRAFARDPLFELENHSLDHAAWGTPCFGLPTVSGDGPKTEELTRTASIVEATAHVTPRYFRFPGGCHSAADVQLVAAHGEQALGWDVDSGDAFQPNAGVVIRSVLQQARPGSIVVMHLIGAPNAPATARALHTLIPTLRARGYRFVTLERLLRG